MRGLIGNPGRAAVAVAAGLAALTLAGCGAPAQERLTVLAAASLTEALPRIDAAPAYSFAGSNQLAEQIRQGAPADVFLSASPRYTGELEQDGLVELPIVFACNALVLIVPAANPAGIAGPEDVARAGVRLVVADEAVPAGAYTRELLDRLGLAGALANVVSEEPDVKGVVGKVGLGEADAGFVYATDARAAGDAIRAFALPAEANPPVAYEAAVVRVAQQKDAAMEFVERLLGNEGRTELASAGFQLPIRGETGRTCTAGGAG